MTDVPRRLRPDSAQRTRNIVTRTRGAHSAQGSTSAARPVGSTRTSRIYGGASGLVRVGQTGESAVAIASTGSDPASSTIAPYRSVVIGVNAQGDLTAGKAVAIGYGAYVGPSSYEAIAIGNLADATGNDAIAIGTADAEGVGAIAIGVSSGASADGTVAVGWSASSDAYRSATLGYGAFVNSSAERGLAAGAESGVHGAWGTALGARTVADAAGSMAIGCDSGGTGAVSAVTDEIRLGTNSHVTVIEGKLVIADGSGGLHQIVVSTGGALSTVAYP
jgi:hypothetical protein